MRFHGNHNSRKSTVILIGEGHGALQDSLKDLVTMEMANTHVLTVCSGKEAVRLCLAGKPSAVILDADLPELNGIEATRKIHDTWPEIPILLINKEDSKEYRASALSAGARGYVTKHRITADLVPVLKKLLTGSRKNGSS